ncbi:DnaT-like ssDNA-binding domain-containing protein [Enterobacter hormaechei subsp. hoffmannii]|uniref:DnaT-like ssDNA-binding domain-containing protein n=1 Tax=Enterobacter hormaechei TaxID=158836 RepID=UPI00079C7AB9|nr:DnaT-like ssDNA-binding domain-containing protein [Enterobacter hormaechei]MCU2632715.1 DnaT-like ssDNA-binding domain-containing protein [Enterobacter hormaechei subsp. hoffmannii]MCU2747399.1 DnaT-like ssDNA-binding domain-containing protein [Enterobacter hormaechei subsp. hoffmannii]MCU4114312.1 DnaT-like ssDNA-binding domain-containing protein [Enterobacter hormaechei subsp. hoffmannii]MCU4134276.1 DnaT-like ssDNA-binding domain-containing protein [Enterobacter hormaechei subsp. hoffmann
MAGDWIKMRADLHTHPKVVRMASALKADRLRIVGGLHSAWCLFDVHSVDGLLDGYSADTLDDLIGFPGFSRAMMAVGWLEENCESLVMPRFEAHNGQSAKRRAQDADRKRNFRKASASEADRKRTREEKRREDIKDKPHTGGEQYSPVDNSAGGGEPDPDANNAMLNGYVAPGGMGEFGKFQMRDNWKPDPHFIQRAALWGITLKTDITPFELAEFITYWKAEGKAFHHDQWQQKLARSVQQSRARPVAQQQRRDINDVPEPDKAIPQGFRGYQAT